MRNGLANWSNGAAVDDVPDGEDMQAQLVEYKLCRHQASLKKLSEQQLVEFKESFVATL